MSESSDPVCWARIAAPKLGPDQLTQVDMDHFWPSDQPAPTGRWSIDWFARVVELLRSEWTWRHVPVRGPSITNKQLKFLRKYGWS